MAREFSRSQRVGEQVRRLLAELIHDQLKDPRIGMVTLTSVQLSRDLAYAKVYFTVLSDSADASAQTAEALRHASGFLRHELGRRIKLRQTPQLQFIHDTSVDYGRRLSELIDEAVGRDASGHDDDSQEGG